MLERLMLLTMRLITLSVLLTFVVGCSLLNDDDEDQGPAKLVKFEAEAKFKKVWSKSVGNGQGGIYNRLTPVIDGDNIIAAATNGDVGSFNVNTGKKNWRVDTRRFLVGGVGIGADALFVGTAKGEVIALNKADGSERWSVQVGAEVLAPPQANEQLVFVQTYDGRLLGLNLVDGSQVWSFSSTIPALSLRGTSTPLLHRNAVIAAFANGNVVNFDPETGAVRWNVRVALAKGNSEIERLIDIDGAMLLSNNLLFVSSYQGKIVAIDPESWRRIWAKDASSYVGMSEGFSNIYVSGEDGSVTAYDKSGQGVRWAQTILARRKLTGSAVIGSYVIVGDVKGYLHGLSQVDGSIAARTKFDGSGVQADLLKSDELLIAYSNDGKLAAYRLEDK